MSELGLPSFGDPPVGEVALSIQFSKATNLQAAHLGRFWDLIRDEFPKTETHPPVEQVRENFMKPESAPKLRFRFQTFDNFPLPRAWFLSADDTRLIQVQSDRFTCNWRRGVSGGSYPRYPEIRAFFEKYWKKWQAFLTVWHLTDSVRVEQCEITYTNHIARSGVWNDLSDAHRILRLIAPPPALSSDLTPEFTSFASHYLMHAQIDNQPRRVVGRLHVELDPGIEATERADPIFVLSLVARGLIATTPNEALEFFDVGRRLIVTTFRAITTPDMHHVWQLEEGA